MEDTGTLDTTRLVSDTVSDTATRKSTLTCSFCGNKYQGRSGSRYCSEACKQKAKRRRGKVKTA